MKITNLAISNRTAVAVLAVILTIVGVMSYVNLPKESAPQIEFATIVVTTIYPGASPADIESIISQEVEREVSSINGIDELQSISSEGVSTVIVTFLPDEDINEAKNEVRDAVDRAKVDFPSDVEEPMIDEIDSTVFPMITVNLAADYPLSRLRDVAEDLEDEIEGVPGVMEVDLIGGLEREVQVHVDLAAAQGYNISFDDVVEAVQSENVSIPGGSVDIDRKNYLLRVDGEIEDPEEINDFVVTAPGGQPVYVRDIADVTYGFKDRESYARLNVVQNELEDGSYEPVEGAEDLPVIALSVKKNPGENIIETVAGVREAVEAYPAPNGTEITYTGDASEEVESLVLDLENGIISGILFVILVLLFFLGVRNATLVGIAIPLSMFIGFLVFSAMGETLNFMILYSLIIALGMLVDNAVVIVENIYRFMDEGYDRWEAAKLATGEVGMAVAASTATTVGAFAPMLLWPGIMGKFMSYMPLTLIVVLISSLFVALVINPVVTGYLMRVESEERAKRSEQAKSIAKWGVVVLGLVILATSWKTFVFAAVAIPLVIFLYRRFFHPAAEKFSGETMPRFTERYRGFLGRMLERKREVHESIPWRRVAVWMGVGLVGLALLGAGMAPPLQQIVPAPVLGLLPLAGLVVLVIATRRVLQSTKDSLFRNTFALGSFTLGFLLLIAGAALGMISQPASMIFMIPGGLLLAMGIVGIVQHTLGTLYGGGRGTLKFGLGLLAVIGGFTALLWIGGRISDPILAFKLLLLPIVVTVTGLLGMRFGEGRKPFLTDNRARLLTATLGLLIAIFGMFFIAPTGVAFFPDTDPSIVMVTLESPLGTNVEASNAVAYEAEEKLHALMESDENVGANIQDILTRVGVGGDVMFGGGAAGPERAQLMINMVDYAERAERTNETLAKIRDVMTGFPGVVVTIEKQEMGPPTEAPVNIEISGEDFGVLLGIANDIKSRLNAGTSGPDAPLAGLTSIADDANAGRPEFQVNVDRERAAAFGLSTAQVARAVRAANSGVETGNYRTGKNEYDITVRLRDEDRENLSTLQSLTIQKEGGVQVPLLAVADVEQGTSFGSITRLEQRRVITIRGEAAEGVNAPELLQRVQAHLTEYRETLPSGYTVEYTGESEEMEESFSFLTTALLLGISIIALILITQFNSIRNPLIILIATGLSLIGVLLGLILTRTPFGLMTFIGIISLAGIVVNNAIVLIDYIEQLRERGLERDAAVIEGGAVRLRPVLLTAFTTIIGLVPLTFGLNIDFVGLAADLNPNFQFGSENTQFWGPMGTAIISGLTFATFLTLVIVPVMYSSFDSVAQLVSGAFRPAPSMAAAADGSAVVAVTPGDGSATDGQVEISTDGRAGLPADGGAESATEVADGD